MEKRLITALMVALALPLLAQRPSHFVLDGEVPIWNKIRSDTTSARSYFCYGCAEKKLFDALDRIFRTCATANYTLTGQLERIRLGWAGGKVVEVDERKVIRLKRWGKWEMQADGSEQWTRQKEFKGLPQKIIVDYSIRRLTITKDDGSCRALEWDDR